MNSRSIQKVSIGPLGQDTQKKFEAFTTGTGSGVDLGWPTLAGRLFTEYKRWQAFPSEVEDRIVLEQTVIAQADSLDPPFTITHIRVRFGFWKGRTLEKELDQYDVLWETRFLLPK
jgi:hypothetical protein